jgi:hypothetical protein
MYSLTKLNNETVEPLAVHQVPPESVKGYSVIPMLYANIFLCGRKGSGKTNVLYHIMKSCIDKDTQVFVFSSTHNSDLNWLEIKKYLTKNKVNATFFLNVVEGSVSHLNSLVSMIQTEDASHEEKVLNNRVDIVKFDDTDASLKIRVTKKKKITPKYLIVFDDISSDLKKKDVGQLLKHLRHYKSKVIISSQYPNDIDRASRVQVDFWCLFKGFEPVKMEEVFPQLDVNGINFDEFFKIYKNVTATPHSFLYIDKNNNEMRQNFDQKINF